MGDFVIVPGSGDTLAVGATGKLIENIKTKAITANPTVTVHNEFFGASAGNAASTGTGYNTCVGSLAGGKLTTGFSNVYIGKSAGGETTEGQQNIAIGVSALRYNTTASGSVAIGWGALDDATSGSNVAVGYAAGGSVTTAIGNTFIGNNADLVSAQQSYSIAIGHSAKVDQSYSAVIGMTGTTAPLLGLNTTTPGAQIHAVARTAATIGCIIQGAASQSASLVELRDSSSVPCVQFNVPGVGNAADFRGATRTGSHQGGLGLYVTDDAGSTSGIAAFFHSNGTAGLSFGYSGFTSSGNLLVVPGGNFGVADPNSGPGSKFGVYGNVCIGASYYGTGAPSNGLIVQGAVGVGKSSPTAHFHVASPDAGTVGAIIQGATSQTANLQEWQTQAGTIYGSVAISAGGGALNVHGTNGVIAGTIKGNDSGTVNGLDIKGYDYVNFLNLNGSATYTTIRSGTIPLRVQCYGAASPFRFIGYTGFGGAVQFYNNENASTIAEVRMADTPGVTISQWSAGHIPLTVKGASGQTASLQEWQTSAGALLAKINADGGGIFCGTVDEGSSIAGVHAGYSGSTARVMFNIGNPATAWQIDNSGGTFRWFVPGVEIMTLTSAGLLSAPFAKFTSTAAGTVPLIVKGAAAQTANLQQWQNSAGAVKAYVDPDGNSSFANMSCTTAYIGNGGAEIFGTAPLINFKDTDATAGDINASIEVQATDTGDGSEDIDITVYQQIAGVKTALLTADADGVIAFDANRTLTTGALQSPKVRLTAEGGIAVLLVAGENVATGEVVYSKQASGADGKVWKNPTDGDMPIGVVYAGVSADANVWVVTSGIVSVLPTSSLTATRGYVIYSSGTEAGRVDEAATIPVAATHFREVGHWIDTGSGAGAATRAVVHFN